MKKFNEWNEVKKATETTDKYPLFKEREIYNTKLGENVGFEQSGKGDEFVRPVLVIKKLTKEMFFGAPLSTTLREGSFFYGFEFIESKRSTALLVQTRLFSARRLLNKIGMINKNDFKNLREKLNNLIFDGDFTSPSKSTSRPKGNCNDNCTTNIINKSSSENE